MFALATWVLLIMWAVLCLLGQPDTKDVQRGCVGHGKVVSYTAGGMFTFADAGGTVVCSDGRVLEVK